MSSNEAAPFVQASANIAADQRKQQPQTVHSVPRLPANPEESLNQQTVSTEAADRTAQSLVDSIGRRVPSEDSAQHPHHALSSQRPSAQSAEDSMPTAVQPVAQNAQGVKDAVQNDARAVYEKLPSAQAVKEQLPSAPEAANAFTQGLNYIASGLKSLVVDTSHAEATFGTADKSGSSTSGNPSMATDDNRTGEPSADVPRSTSVTADEDMNMPGGYVSETEDADREPEKPKEPEIEALPVPGKFVDETPVHWDGSSGADQTQDQKENVQQTQNRIGARELGQDNTGRNLPHGAAKDHQEEHYNLNQTSTPTSAGQQGSVLDSFNQRTKDSVLSTAGQVGQTAQDTAGQLYQQVPSTKSVKETVESAAMQAKAAVQNAAGQLYQQIPGTQSAKPSGPSGTPDTRGSAQDQEVNAAHKQPPSTQAMKGQVPSPQSMSSQVPSAQAMKESAQSGARSVGETVQGGISSAEKQMLRGAHSVAQTMQSSLGCGHDTAPDDQQSAERDQLQRRSGDGDQSQKQKLARSGESERELLPSDGKSAALSQGRQDSIIDITHPTRPGSSSNAPLGIATPPASDLSQSDRGAREEQRGERKAVLENIIDSKHSVPLHTVESSAEPDVSYEHRPKTLPRPEIVAREQERGSRPATHGAPERVVASRRGAEWAPEAAASPEAVHEKSAVEKELLSRVQPAPDSTRASPPIIAPGSSYAHDTAHHKYGAGTLHEAGSGSQHAKEKVPLTSSSAVQPQGSTSLGGTELQGSVYNGVIGAGSEEGRGMAHHAHSQPPSRSGAPQQAQFSGLGSVNLSVGVKNGVVGAGSPPTTQPESITHIGTPAPRPGNEDH